jgi:DNA-binding IclR family transcriptional regulator
MFHYIELGFMNNTLIKGLQIMELLAHSDRALNLTEIAQQLGLVKSNVHRLLQSLTDVEYVIRNDGTGGYSASTRLWELGSAVLFKLDLRRHAERWMETLMEQTGESVHLSILDHYEVVYLHKIDGLNSVRAYSQIGGRAPVYCVATGKALISFQSKESIGRIASSLKQHTLRTITSSGRFMREIDQIRRQGYAINRGEWREGVYGVAAPVFNSAGHVIAAIGLSGPAARFTPRKVRHFAELLIQAALEISTSVNGGVSYQALQSISRKMVARR